MHSEKNLEERSKGKTREGAIELLTMGDLQSHRKMFNLIRNAFPEVTVSTPTHQVALAVGLMISVTNSRSLRLKSEPRLESVAQKGEPEKSCRSFITLISTLFAFRWSARNATTRWIVVQSGIETFHLKYWTRSRKGSMFLLRASRCGSILWTLRRNTQVCVSDLLEDGNVLLWWPHAASAKEAN